MRSPTGNLCLENIYNTLLVYDNGGIRKLTV